ncbi:MAG: hypothetical protein LGR52_13850 [Candidatus Thiosymbion ectosymbiont of Robbea hypermnestra]|nr:hypothetical protein [Candidatus Thiosymbion ectosymbiont of Robbea hypermnestra]
MSKNPWSSRLLVAALSGGLALPAMAWGPYGPGPWEGVAEGDTRRGPGMDRPIQRRPAVEKKGIGKSPVSDSASQRPRDRLLRRPPWSGYPAPPVGMGTYGPGFPPFSPPAYPFPDGNAFPNTPAQNTGGTPARQPDKNTPPNASTPVPPSPDYGAYPGYGPYARPFQGPPGSGSRGPSRPAGFRLSRAATDDAYTLTIALNGIDPATVQIHTQGNRLILRRTHTTQQTQKNDFGDGRGFARGFSYSSGTVSRSLWIPKDGIPSAMSREDGEDSIRLRIPRRTTGS